MFLNLVCWGVIGLIAAFITARAVDQRGDDPKLAIMLGAAGAALCGFLYALVSAVGVNNFNPASLGAAAIGAVLTMIGWHIVRRAAS
jgi:uncharacterized membrane protein YeaQ/YmgE (transglycosylase-associated protein family)